VAGPITTVAAEILSAFTVDADVQHAMGAVGKTAALEQATRDLGADRAFSGFGRIVPLSAGYELGDPVVVNLRPEGLWILAESGRRRTGQIRPKARRRRGNRRPRGRAAVGSGGRFVAVGRYGPSRGLNTISDTVALIDTRLPDAVATAVIGKLGRR
jgi:hypothetical protein